MIQKATLAGIILAGIVGLSGCAATKVGMYNADEDGYKTALNETTALVNKAKKMGAEWRDIRWPGAKKKKKHAKTLFGKAATAAKAGDYETAIKLLNKAQKHAKLGLAVAKTQVNAGPVAK